MREQVPGVCESCGHTQDAILEEVLNPAGADGISRGYLFNFKCEICGGRLYATKDLPITLVCSNCGGEQPETTPCRIVGTEIIPEWGSLPVTCNNCGEVFELSQ